MEQFGLYMIKSSTGIAGLYIFYWLLLRNETYYTWNRLYLLVSLLVSTILPLFNFQFSGVSDVNNLTQHIQPVVVNGYYKPLMTINNSGPTSILSIIYISGALFFAIRFLLSITKIYYLYLRYPRVKHNGFTTVILNEGQSTFTFFNYLFISRNDYNDKNVKEIIVHEKAHYKEFHSVDCMLLELATIIQWFNPFIWFLKRSLISEHEYLADNRVLEEGFDKVRYQKLLFERSLGISALRLTNNFNSSLLKKRLKMMTINKSSSYAKVKYLLTLPAILITILTFAISISSFAQKGKVYNEVDVMATYNNGDVMDIRYFIQENLNYPELARENKISAKIFVQFVIDENGKVDDVNIARCDILDAAGKEVAVSGYTSEKNKDIDPESVQLLEAEAVRVVNMLDGFSPAMKDGSKVSTQYTVPINFVLNKQNS